MTINIDGIWIVYALGFITYVIMGAGLLKIEIIAGSASIGNFERLLNILVWPINLMIAALVL